MKAPILRTIRAAILKTVFAAFVGWMIFAMFFANLAWPWYFDVAGVVAVMGFPYAMKKWMGKSIKEYSRPNGKENRRPHELDELLFGKDGNSKWVTVAECDEAIVWLKAHRDQGLWYDVVTGFNYDRDCTYETVEWIIQQPDCQNTIAVTVMDLIGMSDYCGEGALRYREERTYSILMVISQRDQENPFPSDLLGDPKRLDRNAILAKCLTAQSECKAAGKQPLLPVPLDTLSTIPTGPLPSTSYSVDEEGIGEFVKNDPVSAGADG